MLRRVVCALLMVSTSMQPILAAAQVRTEYRIPLSHVKNKPPTTKPNDGGTTGPGTGTGNGDVEVDEGSEGPMLEFSPEKLSFDLTRERGGTQSSLLLNTGTEAARVTGFVSNSYFTVSHDCPAMLPAGDGCLVTASRTANTVPGAEYKMTVLVPGAPSATLGLYAHDTPPTGAVLEVSSQMIDMGELDPGEAKSGSTVLTNIGTGPANLRGIVSSDKFTVTSDCPENLLPSASCTIAATFASFVPGTHKHGLMLTVSAMDEGLPITFFSRIVSNPAIQAALAFGDDELKFGTLQPGASETKQIVLYNVGTAPAVLKPLKSAPNFKVQSDCPASLPVRGQCNVSVTFTAGAAGSPSGYVLTAQAQDEVSAEVLVMGQAANDPNNPTNSSALVVTPSTLEFGDVMVGQSRSLTAKAVNTGDVPLKVTGSSIEYAKDASFSHTTDCVATLAPGASCEVTVKFEPSIPKERGAVVMFSASDNSKASVGLTGTGRQAILEASPTQLGLGVVASKTAIAPRTIFIGNPGNIALTGLTVVNNDPRLTIDYGDCTATILPKAGCAIVARFLPTSDGPYSSGFTLTSQNGGNLPITITGGVAKVELSPSPVVFPQTLVGQTAPDQYVTVTNRGEVALAIDGVSVADEMYRFGQSNNCGSPLAPGGSCTVTVRYAPYQTGEQGAVLAVAALGEVIATTSITGSGYSPRLTLSNESLTFPKTNVGATSPVLSVIVLNETDIEVAIKGISLADNPEEFGQTNNCKAPLAPGGSCTISAQMKPRTTDPAYGAIALDTTLGTYLIRLSGEGSKPEIVIETPPPGPDDPPPPPPPPGPTDPSRFAIAFRDTEMGQTSAIRSVKFRNSGDGPLVVQGISLLSGKDDFNQNNDCAAPIAPGGYCTVSIVFKPSQTGPRTGVIGLASESGTFYFDLSGKGLGASALLVADSTSSFGNIGAGQSAQRSFTFHNVGSTAAQGVMAQLDDANFSFIANTCGTPSAPTIVAAGNRCAMTVKFNPQVLGAYTSKLQVSSTAENGVQVLSLSGSAVKQEAVLVADTSADFGEVSSGTSVSLTFSYFNQGGIPVTGIRTDLSGPGMTLTRNTCGTASQPGTLSVDTKCSLTVQYSPAQMGAVKGLLSVYSDVPQSPATLELTGSGKYSTNGYALQFEGAEGSKTISDTGTGSAWYSYNGASITMANSRNGSGSLSFNGVNQAAYGPVINFVGDFSASAWVRPTAHGSFTSLLGQWRQGHMLGGWILGTDSAGRLSLSWAPYSENYALLSTTEALPLNTWSHIAVSRSGNMFRIYLNGVVVASGTSSGDRNGLNVPFTLGSYYNFSGELAAANYFKGQMDDVRVTIGSGSPHLPSN